MGDASRMVSSPRVGAARAMVASKSDRRGRATMLSVNFIRRKLSVNWELGKSLWAGFLKIGGVAHRRFYSLLLQGTPSSTAHRKKEDTNSISLELNEKERPDNCCIATRADRRVVYDLMRRVGLTGHLRKTDCAVLAL